MQTRRFTTTIRILCLTTALACAAVLAVASSKANATAQDDSGASGIFFIRSRDIWLSNVNGSDEKRVTHVATQYGGIDTYVWIPKSQTLVYSVNPDANSKGFVVATINAMHWPEQKSKVIFRASLPEGCTPLAAQAPDADYPCADYRFPFDASPDGKIVFNLDFLTDKAAVKRYGLKGILPPICNQTRCKNVGVTSVIYDPASDSFETTKAIPENVSLTFLPDGSAAAWSIDGNIYTYTFSSKTLTQWTHYPSNAAEYDRGIDVYPTAYEFIGWSPDASKVFFTCGIGPAYRKKSEAACEASLTSADVKKLSTDDWPSFSGPGNHEHMFAMSPDRTYFFYAAYTAVQKIDTATGEASKAAFEWIGTSPSPSGQVFLYVGDDLKGPNGRTASVFAKSSDGSDARLLIRDGTDPHWQY